MLSRASLLPLWSSRAILTLFVTLILSSAAFSQTQIPCPVHSPYPGVPTSLDDGYNGINGCEIEGPGGATVDLGQTFTNYTVGELVIESGIPLTNSGTIVNDGGTIINDGTIANSGTLTNDGTLTNNSLIGVDAGGYLENSGTINNLGKIAVDGTLGNYNILTNGNGGTLQIDFGGTLTSSGTITNDLSGTILVFGTLTSSLLTNVGTITNSGGTINNLDSLTNFLGTINNAGTFNNNYGATLTNVGTLTNYYGATFTNLGTVINDTTMTNDGTLNSATLTNNGTLTNDGTLNTGFSSLTTNNSGAAILNDSGAMLSISGTINDAGTITNYGTIANGNGFLNIQAGGVLNNLAGSTYTQGGADLIVDGTLNSVPTVQIQGGVLSGAGTINANVNNSGGTVAPGPFLGTPGSFLATPGTLTINGNYTQGSGGTLLIDLGGTAPGDFSVLDLSGLAMLDGAVDFTTVDGFTPVAGDDFTFLLFGAYSGDFTSIDFTNWACPVDDICTDVFDADSLTLEITGPATSTPEPSSLPLLAMGILALGVCCRWKRAAAIA